MLAALAVFACTGPRPEDARSRPQVVAGEFGEPGCFLRRQVQDFHVLDDRNLLVFAPDRQEGYHVQVSPPASGLRFATVLAFDSRSSRICGYPGDALLLRDGSPNRLSVTSVYRLDEPATQGLLARFRQGATRPVPSPAPGGGAAIERDLDSGEAP